MAIFQVELSLPKILYHGTSFPAIKGIREKPINSAFWKKDKDFGAGFYTTIDLFQSTRWARKPIDTAVKAYLLELEEKGFAEYELDFKQEQLPAVAVLECNSAAYTDIVNVVDFRGECREWAHFILRHRDSSDVHSCSCERHADIVCGIMADNDTGEIIKEFKNSNRQLDNEEDLNWFWKRIVQTKHGKVLNGLELGDQIAFFDERLNSMLQLKGYYLYRPEAYLDEVTPTNYRQEWQLYDAEGNHVSEHESGL